MLDLPSCVPEVDLCVQLDSFSPSPAARRDLPLDNYDLDE